MPGVRRIGGRVVRALKRTGTPVKRTRPRVIAGSFTNPKGSAAGKRITKGNPLAGGPTTIDAEVIEIVKDKKPGMWSRLGNTLLTGMFVADLGFMAYDLFGGGGGGSEIDEELLNADSPEGRHARGMLVLDELFSEGGVDEILPTACVTILLYSGNWDMLARKHALLNIAAGIASSSNVGADVQVEAILAAIKYMDATDLREDVFMFASNSDRIKVLGNALEQLDDEDSFQFNWDGEDSTILDVVDSEAFETAEGARQLDLVAFVINHISEVAL